MRGARKQNEGGETHWRPALTVGAIVTVVALMFGAAGATLVSQNGRSENTAAIRPTTAIRPTAAELVQWQRDTATPFQREQLVEKMRAAFAGVAAVGVGDTPSGVASTTQAPQSSTTTPGIQEVVALGITGDHFWVVASYADMARGAIWAAVGVCVSYGVPGWLCSSAGWILTTWSQGWGYANSHGVWAAVYWWPPRITGGRW